MSSVLGTSLNTDQKRRLVRRLVQQEGRGLAEANGFPVTNNPANLFALLYLSMLAAGRRDYHRAVGIASALREQGWNGAAPMAHSLHERRAAVLRKAGVSSDAERLAITLGDLAQTVLDRYRGDLRRLRSEAHRDPATVRRLLAELPGIDKPAVDLFVREVQSIWPELGPFLDRPALRAADRLGLGRRVEDVVALTGDESEKLAWLAGALARVDQEDSYDRVRTLAMA